MSTKTNQSENNISEELIWLEKRLQDIKDDIDSQQYSKIEDRIVTLATAKGTMQKVSATEEQQKKAIREALKEYTILLAEVDKLREAEKAKIKGRGSANINSRMKNLMAERK